MSSSARTWLVLQVTSCKSGSGSGYHYLGWVAFSHRLLSQAPSNLKINKAYKSHKGENKGEVKY